MPTILLTGAAGYIGSHACVEVLAAGWDAVILDNLSNSSAKAVERVAAIAGRMPTFVRGDVRDAQALADLFGRYPIDAVVHFAGLKAVGESVAQPLKYYDNNVSGTVTLLAAMRTAGVKRLVFSSSATVYGTSTTMPLTESSPLGPINPYGRSKLIVEEIARDLAAADPDWRVMLLRYFNPVGAHPSGLIGEDPVGVPNNLMPFVAQVAVRMRDRLTVHGDDYPTSDGTGVRDYIHVVDLAQGHVAALRRILSVSAPRELVANLGTGRGYSVLDMIRAFERASGRSVPYVIGPRRPGDAAVCYADASRAAAELGWSARLDIDAMCADTWRWQEANPRGYRDG
jgi:UDP-glucose 4-epimerase